MLTQNLPSCQKSSFETQICSANLKIDQKYKLQLCFRVYKTITDTNWVIMLITHIICWVKFIRLRFPLNNFIIHKIDLALFTQRYNQLVTYLPELDLQTLAYLKWSFCSNMWQMNTKRYCCKELQLRRSRILGFTLVQLSFIFPSEI